MCSIASSACSGDCSVGEVSIEEENRESGVRTPQACNQLQTGLEIWWRLADMRSDQVVQVGVNALLQSRQEGVADFVDFAALVWCCCNNSGRRVVCLGRFQGVFVESLGNIFLTGK